MTMANKKLIEDLKNLVDYPDQYILESHVADVAGRVLEEIEYLENLVKEKQDALDWYDFQPGDMK